MFGEGHHPDSGQIYAGLGTVWETDRITVKAYAAMGLLHAAIDAALQLRSEDRVQADQIERIDIDMPEAAYCQLPTGDVELAPSAAPRRMSSVKSRPAR